MATDVECTNLYMPGSLVEALRRHVPARKRSDFIIRATENELRRVELAAAIDDAFGAWRDEDHPELATDEDIDRYVRDLRAAWRPPEEEEEAQEDGNRA